MHEGFDGYFRVNWKKHAYYAFYVNFCHLDIRAYLSTKINLTKDALFLFDRVPMSNKLLEKLFKYIENGGILVYLCTEKNYAKKRKKLLKFFNISWQVIPDKEAKHFDYLTVTGDSKLCKNFFQLPWIPSIQIKGAQPLVYSENFQSKIYLTKKNIGKGTIYIFPFKKIFKTKYMGNATSTRNRNMREQQVRRLQEQLIEVING